MKITGKKSISSVIKVFLIVLFIMCIITMISIPILIKNLYGDFYIENMKDMVIEFTFMYIAAIPALLMIIEFEKIFNDFTKEIIFSRKIEKRLKRSSIYSLIIGLIFLLNSIAFFRGYAFINLYRIMYLIVIILISLIFLILSIGLMVLKNIYSTAVDNKEENDLTI